MSDTFTVDVPGIGEFTFCCRNEHHVHMIDAEKQRLLTSYAPRDDLNAWAEIIATITVLAVKAPDGLLILEGDDQAVAERILAVYSALRDAEDLNERYPFTPTPLHNVLWN